MSVDPDSIQLETYEVALLRRTRQYDDFDDENRERIFREHLAYTLNQVASGKQLAAGPATESPPEDEVICGMGLYQTGSLDQVRQILERDPGVRQGLYRFDVMRWHTGKGRLAFPLASPPGATAAS
jgi:uncharacterized protein YciI